MKSSLVFCLFLLLSLLACTREADEINCATPARDSADWQALQLFFQTHGVPTQHFSVPATRDTTILTAAGSRVQVPGQAFRRPDGTVATIGRITLEFREIYKPADMVLSAKPTVSNKKLLLSGGEFYLKATQSQQRLRLTPTARITMRTPLPNWGGYGTTLFYGTGSDSTFTWVAPAPNDPSTVTRDSIAQQPPFYTIILNNDSLGWVNCDRFANFGTTTTAQVVVEGPSVAPDNTVVYIVFPQLNAVIPCRQFQRPNQFFAGSLLTAFTVNVVVIRHIEGQFYYGRQDGTLQAGQRFAPPLKAVSEAELVAEIKKL